MKRHIFLSIAVIIYLSGILLAACGAEEEEAEKASWQGVVSGMDLTDITERTEYYDITVESESLFALELEGKVLQENQSEQSLMGGGKNVWIHLGTQFFEGEPIQLWAAAGLKRSDIYLYRKDGSRELLFEDFSNEYTVPRYSDGETVSRTNCQWYMDQEGNYYCCGEVCRDLDEYIELDGYRVLNLSYEDFFVKILSSGELLNETVMEDGHNIHDLCQTEDSKVYLLLDDRTEEIAGNWQLAELDTATGEMVQESVRELPLKFGMHLGKTGSSPALTGYGLDSYNDRSIFRVDMNEGSLAAVLSFNGITYGWHSDLELQDFQVLEDGGIELLWSESNGEGVLLERLKMEKVEKIPIVVRGRFFGDTWFADKVAQFNMENSTYHVVVEDCGSDNDEEEFARLTSVQISTGKGPDIINGSLMRNYMEGMLEKGALEELTPYMEAAGVREEDYFPQAFASLRQGERIYGANARMDVRDYEMAEEVLGSWEAPEIEALVDVLLARKGEGVFCEGYDSPEVLEWFLQGTESLWGMVDWENGCCDFNTPLFGKLLEAAKQYGDDGRKIVDSIITPRFLSAYGILYFEGQEELEEKGKAAFGALFDDGVYPVSEWGYALAINANSSHKEGAWEFIRFLISEETQSADYNTWTPPLHRKAYETWMQGQLKKFARPAKENGADVWIYNRTKIITEEMLEEFEEKMEEARPLPIRTASILEIVLEEAEYYFSGSKSVEDVSEVINNRVQLYLDERK